MWMRRSDDSSFSQTFATIACDVQELRGRDEDSQEDGDHPVVYGFTTTGAFTSCSSSCSCTSSDSIPLACSAVRQHFRDSPCGSFGSSESLSWIECAPDSFNPSLRGGLSETLELAGLISPTSAEARMTSHSLPDLEEARSQFRRGSPEPDCNDEVRLARRSRSEIDLQDARIQLRRDSSDLDINIGEKRFRNQCSLYDSHLPGMTDCHMSRSSSSENIPIPARKPRVTAGQRL